MPCYSKGLIKLNASTLATFSGFGKFRVLISLINKSRNTDTVPNSKILKGLRANWFLQLDEGHPDWRRALLLDSTLNILSSVLFKMYRLYSPVSVNLIENTAGLRT